MRQLLSGLRSKYFAEVTKFIKPFHGQFIVLTHLLHDRPELLESINNVAPIALVIAIPYSTHQETLHHLKKKYNIVTPTLNQLYDINYLRDLIFKHLFQSTPTMILEIGGYFAKVLKTFNSELEGKLIGVVEDTETGHRAYEQIANHLHYPVVSIARSYLKTNEDLLVGASCLYSTEKLFRTSGFLMDSKLSLVLGYGKVGRGLARSLAKRHAQVMVYDTKTSLRITALSEGFQIPSREHALKNADIIYGTTGVCSIKGDDFEHLKNGVVLVSCSSKNVEFDIESLQQNYVKTKLLDHLDKYEKNGKQIYLAAEGTPINFVDGATIGPILTLTQGEILLAVQDVINLYESKHYGLFETSEKTKVTLAEKWIDCFCDSEGRYKHA